MESVSQEQVNDVVAHVKRVRKKVVKTEPQEVHVKVYEDESGIVNIEGVTKLPEHKYVIAQFPLVTQKKIKRRVDEYYDLATNIKRSRHIVSYQQWADAIGSAIIARERNVQPGNFVTKGLNDGAYLAMGEQLYKLSPVQMISTNKALAAARARVIDKSKNAGKKIVEEAKVAAKAIIDSASEMKIEAKRLLRETKSSIPCPKWVKEDSFVTQFNGTYWCVRSSFNLRLERMDYRYTEEGVTKSYSWELVHKPKKIYFWVPIKTDGSYVISSIHIDQDSPAIPHINHQAACMSLGDAPKKITNADEFEQLRQGIKRCMRAIQMDSLRTSIQGWIREFKDCVPEEVYECLKGTDNYEKLKDLIKPENVVVEKSEEEFQVLETVA